MSIVFFFATYFILQAKTDSYLMAGSWRNRSVVSWAGLASSLDLFRHRSESIIFMYVIFTIHISIDIGDKQTKLVEVHEYRIMYKLTNFINCLNGGKVINMLVACFRTAQTFALHIYR